MTLHCNFSGIAPIFNIVRNSEWILKMLPTSHYFSNTLKSVQNMSPYPQPSIQTMLNDSCCLVKPAPFPSLSASSRSSKRHPSKQASASVRPSSLLNNRASSLFPPTRFYSSVNLAVKARWRETSYPGDFNEPNVAFATPKPSGRLVAPQNAHELWCPPSPLRVLPQFTAYFAPPPSNLLPICGTSSLVCSSSCWTQHDHVDGFKQ